MNIISPLRVWAKTLQRDGVTLWFARRHPATPWYAKAVGLFVVAYALSPIDLIPDFVPVLGYLDDLILLPGLIWLAVKLLPAQVLRDCRREAEAWLATQGRRPSSRAGLLLVLALWAIAALALALWLGPWLLSRL